MRWEGVLAAVKKQGERLWFWLACALSIAMTAGFLVAVHLPLREELAMDQVEADRWEAEVIGIENFMNQHGDLKEYEADVARKKEQVDRALPDAQEQGALIAFLQDCAISRKLQLLSAVPGKQKLDRGLNVLPVQIKLKCDYFQLLDFLEDIQSHGRYLQVENLSVCSVDGELECGMEVMAYAAGGT